MNIKIVICFIIIFFLPAASAATWDNVWVAKSSALIKSNETLHFENYTIKAIVLDDAKASITVYRGQTIIDTVDFNIKDFKKYNEIGITLLGIRDEYSWISVSKLENKELWRLLDRKQLKWGETYSIENYSFNIDTYGSDSVNLTISNISMAQTNLFSVNGIKDFEHLRMVITNINRTGFIDLDFYTNIPPEFKKDVLPLIKVDIQTDKDEYFPDEPIKMSLKITSQLPINIMGIIVGTTPPAEPDRFSITDFTGTQALQSKISMQPANSTVNVRIQIEIFDYLYDSYVIDASKDIIITPEVAIMKIVEADTDEQKVPVQLYIYNSANGSRNITIRDSIPPELSARQFNWTVELSPKNSTTLEYNVTPENPGLYFLPSATAYWDGQSASSKRKKMTMHMPYLGMKKTSVFNDGKTLVKLVTSNTGDRPAQAVIIDKIPDGMQAIGETTWSGKLEAGESATISYSLDGEITALPAASATYRDITGVTRQSQSNTVDTRSSSDVKEKGDTNEPAVPLNVLPGEMISFVVLSFIVIAGIISGAAMIAYLTIRYGGKK